MLEMAKSVIPGNSGLAQRIDRKVASIYREFSALRPLSLDIRKGESWGFLGVNGSGKSTLLKMISGNLRPSSGRIEVDGRVAILDYSSGLHGDFTGRENIFLKAAVLGMTRRDVEAKLTSIIDFADIGGFIDQPVKTYSSGMVARLGFAIVAHTEADIIITDEALAVGDAFFVQKCMDFIRGFLKRGTFLFVSHSTNDVISLCQKAAWLDHGDLKMVGSAKDVAEAYLGSHSLARSKDYLERQAKAVQEAADEAAEARADHTEGSERERSMAQPALAEATNARPTRRIRDARVEVINGSKWRNDIEIPELTMDAGTGVGGARIEEVALEDSEGDRLSWVIGGDAVRLRITVKAQRRLTSPIVGFQVRDRLGQTLFADNTYLATLDNPLVVASDSSVDASFEFQMPLLPVGVYAVRAAVADGAESDNAMLHCVDTAMVFRSVTSGARHGLVGVPMERVSLARVD